MPFSGTLLNTATDGLYVDFSAASQNLVLEGGAVGDVLIGALGPARNTLRGNAGDDILFGGSHGMLDGGAGDDQIGAVLGGGGDVRISGGDGFDLAALFLYGGDDAVFSLDGDGTGGATFAEANSDVPEATLSGIEAYHIIITNN